LSVCVWQCKNTTSNYDTDVLHHLSKVEEITGLKYTPNSVILNDSEESEEQNKTNIAIRVIVDHVRAVAFAIADGQLPSIQEQDM
jgi:alanyl-tRNA synthetase